jgi:carbon storage regulator
MTISYDALTRRVPTRKGKGMLILMRRPGESIHIGPNIVVTLVSLERNRARIGIEAPREVTVDREEIARKKKDGLEPPPKTKRRSAAEPDAAEPSPPDDADSLS